MFLHSYIEEFNNHFISSELHSLSGYAFLLVHIIIKKEFIQEKKLTIIKNSEKEKEFMKELKARISNVEISNIYSCEMLETITQKFASIVEKLWYKYSKPVNITKYFKI